MDYRSVVTIEPGKRAQNRNIWDFARRNDFTIGTLDADFADMAALYGPPPSPPCCAAAQAH